jgi:hypothetical protein
MKSNKKKVTGRLDQFVGEKNHDGIKIHKRATHKKRKKNSTGIVGRCMQTTHLLIIIPLLGCRKN